jgi:hypothetical protein
MGFKPGGGEVVGALENGEVGPVKTGEPEQEDRSGDKNDHEGMCVGIAQASVPVSPLLLDGLKEKTRVFNLEEGLGYGHKCFIFFGNDQEESARTAVDTM